jgi:uncharacterized protein (DUF927 family)
VWSYRGASGELLGYRCRFEPTAQRPKKEVIPLILCEEAAGNHRWRWKDWNTPRPLYGLDQLAARPDAVVIVTEGEKDADAAAERFPDCVAVTSPGGASAAKYADWSPLRGRVVIVWSDADAAGARYAADVARLACAAGAAGVRVVQVPDALRTIKHNWGLADRLPDGWTVDTLRELLDAARLVADTAPNDSPADAVKRPFRLTERSVEHADEDKDGNVEWVPVCSRLEVLALTRDGSGEEWGRLLSMIDADGNTHEWAMPMSLLAGDGAAYRERLLSLGLHIEPGGKARNRLHSYISTTRPTQRARCVSRVGWHATATGGVYVLPDHTYGVPGERVLLQTATTTDHGMRCAGALPEWQEHVAALCAGNSRLVFALSCAFAAPLLYLANEEGGGFHLRGPSSTGKTTALRVAGSAWGGGGVSGYLRTWRATANGLEGLAEMHCDALLCLDEMGQVNGREAGEVAYMLANGSGKSRAARDGVARRAARWRLLFLSTGELSLAEKMFEAGQRARAGQEARLVDVVADAGVGFGLFEDLHAFPSAEAFARHLCDASARLYGVAIREYMTRLAADLAGLSDALTAARRQWVSAHCPTGADGQVQRVASRFGLVAAAGELASAMGVLPWRDDEASVAAARCFAAWLDARGGTGAAEIAAGLAQARHFFALHGESRFSRFGDDNSDRPTINRAGFRRDDGAGGTEFFVLPIVWREEICRGFDAHALARGLVARGVLVPDASDGKPQSRHRLPGAGVRRVYRVTAAILGDGGDDA